MRKDLAVPFAIGLAVIIAAIGGVLFMQRGAHIELKGAILKVRTLALDDNSSIMVVDFRFANPADYPFVIKSVTLQADQVEGFSVPEIDARRIFEYYPLLGKKFNDTLVAHEKIPARESQDRMIAARFEVPESKLTARKRLVLRIEDVDGPVSELVEGNK
jgi:hypothetical protein